MAQKLVDIQPHCQDDEKMELKNESDINFNEVLNQLENLKLKAKKDINDYFLEEGRTGTILNDIGGAWRRYVIENEKYGTQLVWIYDGKIQYLEGYDGILHPKISLFFSRLFR